MHAPPPAPRLMTLDAGAQLIVNGALVTVLDPCRIELGSGAVVISGKELSKKRAGPDPTRELYFALLKASENDNGLAEGRYDLFRLLARVVAQHRTHSAQRECALCAAALIAGDHKSAIGSARRLQEVFIAREQPNAPQQAAPQAIGTYP